MNIAKLNTASLDDKTYIIKRGNGGGGTPSGGGSGEGGGSNVEYWSMPTNAELINEMALLFLLIKGKVDGNINIFSAWNLSTPNIVPTAFAIDREIEIVVEGAKMKVSAFLENMGMPDFSTFGWVQITKEQFYSLD